MAGALVLEQWQPAQAYAEEALALAEARRLPDIAFPARHLTGQLAVQAGDLEAGLAAFEQAIQDIESLCGRMMVEFRASFVEDKERINEDAVDLSLRLGQPLHALELAERAKSRALLEMLAHRLDLSISVRNPADKPIVEELQDLRAQRDRLYRRMQSGEGYGQRGDSETFLDTRDSQGQRILALESKITELWHRLLIRNADYAREANLWQVRSEQIQPFIEPGTLLLEYYCIRGQFIAFLATGERVSARRLEISITQVQQLLQLLWLDRKPAKKRPGNFGQAVRGLAGAVRIRNPSGRQADHRPAQRPALYPLPGALRWGSLFVRTPGDQLPTRGECVALLPARRTARNE
jgi:hypothetical protein